VRQLSVARQGDTDIGLDQNDGSAARLDRRAAAEESDRIAGKHAAFHHHCAEWVPPARKTDSSARAGRCCPPAPYRRPSRKSLDCRRIFNSVRRIATRIGMSNCRRTWRHRVSQRKPQFEPEASCPRLRAVQPDLPVQGFHQLPAMVVPIRFRQSGGHAGIGLREALENARAERLRTSYPGVAPPRSAAAGAGLGRPGGRRRLPGHAR